MRKASDALCLKYGLSVIEPKNGKGKSYAQWMAEQDGKRPGEPRSVWISGMQCRELHMETVPGSDEAEGIPVEAEPEVHCIKSTGNGTVYPSAEPWEELFGRGHPTVDLAAKEQDTCWKRRSFPTPEKKLKGIQALYYSYLYQMVF